MKQKAEIGIIGGSGFYDLAQNLKEIKVETPYGPPSGKIAVGQVAGRQIAFLSRHGKNHRLPPHKIPYQANIWALKDLGVDRIITCTAVGSLQKEIKPGDFVLLDQFVDRTRHRQDTFYHGPVTTHVSCAYPYCPQLSQLAYQVGKRQGISLHPKGTVVVIEGPRFSTAAESAWFTQRGWEVINMTQYPEVVLARELALCYCTLALVTDYDVGIVSMEKIKPVTAAEVLKVFAENNKKAQKLILAMIKNLPQRKTCQCHKALEAARVE